MSRCSGRFRSAPACGPSCRSRGPLGPVEADLASLVVRDRIHGPYPPAREALAAYGPYGAELVELYVPVQALFLTAWLLATVRGGPELNGCWTSAWRGSARVFDGATPGENACMHHTPWSPFAVTLVVFGLLLCAIVSGAALRAFLG